MSPERGRLIVISAPSGCGKTTIVERLLARQKSLKRSISYTTRSPRAGEVNGRDYYFVTPEEFEEKRRKGFFLECANVFGSMYGTSKDLVQEDAAQGVSVVLAIDVQGMKQLRELMADVVPIKSIFILPPSLEELKNRLRDRKTETEEQIVKRLEIAKQEIAEKNKYDFQVVNREIDKAVEEIERILK